MLEKISTENLRVKCSLTIFSKQKLISIPISREMMCCVHAGKDIYRKLAYEMQFDHFYLPPAAEGHGWEIIKRLPYVRPSVRLSCFCINLNISFIYEHIFTKFAGNVYGYENLSLQNFSLILKNKMAAIANCLKIVKVL